MAVGRKWTMEHLFAAFVALLLPQVALADIYHYKLDLKAYGSEDNLRFRQSGMFGKYDAPSQTSPGDGHSFIDFGALELGVQPGFLTMAYPGAVTYVEVAVFHSSHMDELGVDVPGAAARQYCCTPWVQNRTGCHPARGLIRSLTPEGAAHGNSTLEIIRVPVPLVPGERVNLGAFGFGEYGHAKYTRFKVRKSGLYTLLLANCDATNAVDVQVTGHTVWMNPYGYLPGELFGMMPFFGVMACVYAVAVFAWCVLAVWHWSELTTLQSWVTAVLVMGLLENAVKFGDYLSWNAEGHRNPATLAAALVLSVTKRALSRALVVMVSLGYSVVRPSLGLQLFKVLGLAAAYFLLALTYDLMVELPSNGKLASKPAFVDSLTLLVLLLAFVDVIFYTWILQSLVGTIGYLEHKHETNKLVLFRRFRAVLLFSVALSATWSLYSVAASSQGYYKEHWESAWSVNAAWEVIYIVVLLAIAFLWMPSAHATRYAYSSQLKTFDPDDKDGGGYEDEGEEYDDDDVGDEAMNHEYGGSLEDDKLSLGRIASGTEKLT